MALRIRRIGPDDIPNSRLTLEALARVLKPAVMAEAIDGCGACKRRTRKLPATAVLLLCVAMNLYADGCLSHVFFRLASRMRWLFADPGAARVSKGAFCQVRYRLGAKPVAELFRRVCEPLSTPSTPAPDGPRRQARLLEGRERVAAGEGGRRLRLRVRHPRHMRRGGMAP